MAKSVHSTVRQVLTPNHPVTPYEEHLLRAVEQAEERVAELEQQLAKAHGEIKAEGICPYCFQRVRLLVRYNTSAEPIYLQCAECLGPMRLPEPIF